MCIIINKKSLFTNMLRWKVNYNKRLLTLIYKFKSWRFSCCNI